MGLDLIAVGDVMVDGMLPAPVAGRRVHGKITLRVGGSAVNAALAAVRRGGRAAVVGRVGDDDAGRLVALALAEAGVEALLARDAAARTGCVFLVGDDVVAEAGASALLSPDDVPARLEAHALLVSGYTLLQSGSEAAARAALGRQGPDVRAVDVGSARLAASFGADRFFDATSGVDVLLANAEEARALTGLAPAAAARRLARRYRVVCVKLGREGAIAAAGGELAHAAVPPIEAGDTLGAGDAFAAGFLLSLADEAPVDAALEAGCAAAEAAVAGNR